MRDNSQDATNSTSHLMEDRRGLTSVEYAVIIGVLAPAITLSFSGMLVKIQAVMNSLTM